MHLIKVNKKFSTIEATILLEDVIKVHCECFEILGSFLITYVFGTETVRMAFGT